jgi:hypothetical protein
MRVDATCSIGMNRNREDALTGEAGVPKAVIRR